MTRRLHLVTGPSGAGKSVFCKNQPDWEHCLYNLDDFARQHGDADDYANREKAWASLLSALRGRMVCGDSVLCVDCVFGQTEFTQAMTLAKEYGYRVSLWVISPVSADVCADRIRRRQAEGGHGRPDLAGEMFENALTAAAEFSLECGDTVLIDSTGEPVAIAYLHQFSAHVLVNDPPQWAQEYFAVQADCATRPAPASVTSRS